MENIFHKIQCACILLLLPFGVLGGSIIAENILTENFVAFGIGVILVFISAIMFTFVLIADRFE